MAGLLRWVCGFGGSLVFLLLRHLDCVLIEEFVFLVVGLCLVVVVVLL